MNKVYRRRLGGRRIPLSKNKDATNSENATANLFPPGEVTFLGNLLVTKGIDVRGAFRFHGEFDDALQLLAGGLDVDALISATVPLDQAVEAFALTADRRRASKVLPEFDAAHQS